ncbi:MULTISPECIES: SusC/RagA family TonB-linked outer membrane protein [Chryseobacterium]|uniref:SusC/RagA family TonB-linked outer membrane protein n=1 Tax=Chryseobacterium TaxID=59732 RepID=UPI001625DF17|nr:MULTISPECIES: SusC/RagA family TonB-linked outer membrane protein [Chryseobacterium]MDM1554471.1 SusC/RagA family TonB-linked outer membrane protein [Chryseobacterium indologenes]
MKKLTTGLLVLVLSSSIAVANAQQKKDTVKTKEIEGVVVTALGIKREKKALGYASQEIKGDILREGANTGNLSSQMAGKAAGVQVVTSSNFGGASSVVIRGMKSIGGNNQALFVIDGVPVSNNNSTISSNYSIFDGGNSISDINPNDIESVNVLKGAAASALYGERASSGVVVITTKKGKSRKDNEWGVTLSTEYQYGEIDRSTFAKYQNQYGAGYGGSSFVKQDIDGDGIPDNVVGTHNDASVGSAFDPSLMVYQWNSLYPQLPGYRKATPWVAGKHTPVDFFQAAQTTSNSITLEKGNDKSSVLINYNNFLTTGVLPNSDQKKNTFSAKFDYKVTDKLTATVYSSLTMQNTIGRNSTGYNDNLLTSFRQWWQTNVDIYDLRDAYFNSGGQNITWNLNSYKKPSEFFTPAFWNNPYFDRYQNYQSDDRTRFFGYAMLNYKLSNTVNLTGRISSDFANQKTEVRKAVGSHAESFGIVPGLVSALNPQPNASSGYYLSNLYTNEINFDLFANFNKKFDNEISLGALLGASLRRNIVETTDASTQPDKTGSGLIVPGLYAIRNSAGQVVPTQEFKGRSSLPRGYGQVSLGYKDTYFLEATGSVDQSSNLPDGENIYFYPSISGSVVLSNLIQQDWLSFLKVRGNWAQVGKTTDNFRLVDTYNIKSLYGSIPIVDPNNFKNNANLKPERSTEIEVGMEARFLNNRVGFDVSLYKTNSKDQILLVPVSASSGYTRKWYNAGELENKGIEVQLNLVPLKSENFRWDMNWNWAINKNKVLSLNEGIKNLQLGTAVNDVTFNAPVGEAYGQIWGTDFIYSPDGQKVIDPDTGAYKMTATKTNVIGNIMPNYTWSVRNSITYKAFSFTFLIDGQQGGDVFSGDMLYGTDTGIYPETLAIRQPGVILPGVVMQNGQYVPNNVPLGADNAPSETGSILASGNYPAKQFVYDASFIKLREAAIYFDIPKSLYANTFIKSMKFGIFGRNLWIIHKNLPYADPEAGYTGGSAVGVQGANLSRGYSIGAMPTTRTFGANFTVNF